MINPFRYLRSIKLDRKNLVRKNFLINCIILTLISVVIAIGSSRYLFKHTLPTDNFVTVTTIVTVDPECNPFGVVEGEDSGINASDLCESGSIEIFSTRASAAAIKTVDGFTYFLTAEHFCNIEDVILTLPPFLRSSTSTTMQIYKDGVRTDFEIVKMDTSLDLCLIRSTYNISENLHLASSMPEIGEQTKTISSPLGISEKNVNFHFTGTFSGCSSMTCYFTIPAISGSSGSLVLNYNNEIVGMTQQSLIGFPEVTIGVGVYSIRDFLKEYRQESGIDLL